MKKSLARMGRTALAAFFVAGMTLVAAPQAIAANAPDCVQVSVSHESISLNGGATTQDFYYANMHNNCSYSVQVRAEHGPFTWAWYTSPCYSIAAGETMIGHGYPWGPNNIINC